MYIVIVSKYVIWRRFTAFARHCGYKAKCKQWIVWHNYVPSQRPKNFTSNSIERRWHQRRQKRFIINVAINQICFHIAWGATAIAKLRWRDFHFQRWRAKYIRLKAQFFTIIRQTALHCSNGGCAGQDESTTLRGLYPAVANAVSYIYCIQWWKNRHPINKNVM